jgi:hypothetical protein
MYSGARTQEHYAFALVFIARGELANLSGVSCLMLFNLESQKLVDCKKSGFISRENNDLFSIRCLDDDQARLGHSFRFGHEAFAAFTYPPLSRRRGREDSRAKPFSQRILSTPHIVSTHDPSLTRPLAAEFEDI